MVAKKWFFVSHYQQLRASTRNIIINTVNLLVILGNFSQANKGWQSLRITMGMFRHAERHWAREPTNLGSDGVTNSIVSKWGGHSLLIIQHQNTYLDQPAQGNHRRVVWQGSIAGVIKLCLEPQLFFETLRILWRRRKCVQACTIIRCCMWVSISSTNIMFIFVKIHPKWPWSRIPMRQAQNEAGFAHDPSGLFNWAHENSHILTTLTILTILTIPTNCLHLSTWWGAIPMEMREPWATADLRPAGQPQRALRRTARSTEALPRSRIWSTKLRTGVLVIPGSGIYQWVDEGYSSG